MTRINQKELLKELKSEQDPYKYDDVGTYGKGKYDGLDRAIELVESSEEKESEETEVKKDKEWAIKVAKETINGFFDRSSRGVAQHYEDELTASIADIINQLDEPETLSREWISEDVEYAYFDMLDGSGRLSSATAIIKPKKLQNLLVPKQDEQIAKTVADVIADFYKSLERLKEVLRTEYEELEE